MTWPDPPKCRNCRHTDTKEYGRVMGRDCADRLKDPTVYYFKCGGCGRIKSVKNAAEP